MKIVYCKDKRCHAVMGRADGMRFYDLQDKPCDRLACPKCKRQHHFYKVLANRAVSASM